jgi:hypothetical protein
MNRLISIVRVFSNRTGGGSGWMGGDSSAASVDFGETCSPLLGSGFLAARCSSCRMPKDSSFVTSLLNEVLLYRVTTRFVVTVHDLASYLVDELLPGGDVESRTGRHRRR